MPVRKLNSAWLRILISTHHQSLPMDMELAMRLSCVTLYHLPCVPWVRRGDRRGEERRRWGGQTRKKAEGTLTPPPPTFRSQRDTSQTSRINLKDCVTWAAEQLKGFSSYRFKWEFKSGHFMPGSRGALHRVALDLASSHAHLMVEGQMWIISCHTTVVYVIDLQPFPCRIWSLISLKTSDKSLIIPSKEEFWWVLVLWSKLISVALSEKTPLRF